MGQGCRDWQWTPSQFTRRRTFEVEGNCSAAGSFLAFFYTLKPVNKFMGANGTAPLRPSIPPNVGSRANKLIGHWEGRSHIVTYNYVRISNHMVRNHVFRMFIQQWNVRSNNPIQTCLNYRLLKLRTVNSRSRTRVTNLIIFTYSICFKHFLIEVECWNFGSRFGPPFCMGFFLDWTPTPYGGA